MKLLTGPVTELTEAPPAATEHPAPWLHGRPIWIALGFLLFVFSCSVVALSWAFGLDKPLADQPIAWFVFFELGAGLVFLFAAYAVVGTRIANPSLTWLIIVGLGMRLVMMGSTPILEHDYYRYLWDGAVVARGMNPFRYSPAQVTDPACSVPEALRSLAGESGDVLASVNHPDLRTIYPPVAQAAFALAHAIKPWSLIAWRAVLALFDLGTALLLMRILRNLDIPVCLLALYWWNPLVVREIYNTGHMDVVALPFVLYAIVLSVRGWCEGSAVALALAVGVKLWPLALLPVILSPLWRNPRQLVLCTGVFAGTVLLLFAPIYLTGLDADSGFVSYGLRWRVNESLFRMLSEGVRILLTVLSWDSVHGYMVTRVAVAGLMGAWVGWLCRSVPEAAEDWWHRSLLVVAAVFLLSPAGFPWYFVWVVPFLVIRPTMPLLLLNCLLPLYYLVFYYRARHDGTSFDSYIVWFEYLPVAAAMGLSWLAPRRGR